MTILSASIQVNNFIYNLNFSFARFAVIMSGVIWLQYKCALKSIVRYYRLMPCSVIGNTTNSIIGYSWFESNQLGADIVK